MISSIRERSGSINIKSKLVGFLYDIMRDHIPPGVIEEILLQTDKFDNDENFEYSNGWLAQYAQDVAERLIESKNEAIPKSTKEKKYNE